MSNSVFINFKEAYIPVAFIFLFAVGLVVLALILKFASTIIRRRNIYRAKGFALLNISEIRFFNALSKVIPTNAFICPKVRIADLVEVNLPEGGIEFWSSFNKISQKHVDFVVCNRIDFAPILIIELDGGSHNEKHRQKRDKFVDDVFMDSGIPILHISASKFYDYKVLREQLGKAFDV